MGRSVTLGRELVWEPGVCLWWEAYGSLMGHGLWGSDLVIQLVGSEGKLHIVVGT